MRLTGGARIPDPPLYLQASLEPEADMKEMDAEARRALGMDQGVDPISFDQNGVAAAHRAGARQLRRSWSRSRASSSA